MSGGFRSYCLSCLCRPSRGTTVQGHLVDAAGEVLDVEVRRVTLADEELSAGDVYIVHDISRYAALNRLREQLLYNATHELRAPLTVLENTLEIIASEYGELSADELDGFIRSARRNARRLRGLIEGLLSAGSIQSGRFVVHPKPVGPRGIVDEALDTVETMIESRRQHLECDLPDGLPAVFADKRYAGQVLANLLANASKYSPEGEVIQVRAESTGEYVRITVEDHGPGIPWDQQAGLFKRFYRARSGDETPGIGLGLAIAKGIVEAHHGTIGVDRETGTGTCVWCTLPAAKGTAE